jgi:hypothetical protein
MPRSYVANGRTVGISPLASGSRSAGFLGVGRNDSFGGVEDSGILLSGARESVSVLVAASPRCALRKPTAIQRLLLKPTPMYGLHPL